MNGESVQSSSYRVLGVRVDAVQLPEVCRRVEKWIEQRDACHYVAVTGMHGIMEAQHDPEFKSILNAADLVVPDGMPLVWLSRFRGRPLRRRVYGPELMLEVCQQTASTSCSHFLVGGAPGVADRLATVLIDRFPGLVISGTCSPPFHPLTESQEQDLVATINRAAPDIVWFGFSTPKQEQWMHRYRDRLKAAVLLGVGAAFDIHTGNRRQAPRWMRENGWEWLFRLVQEPKRLWRRYLIYGPQFLFYVALELLQLKSFE
jgi:N-acetylglucosaminyldiphosphoundecaprenol N-acetyl-beta-D-mannosaminyltransferase